MNAPSCLNRRDFLKLSALFASSLVTGSLCKILPASFQPESVLEGDLGDFIRTKMQAARIPGLAACIVRENAVVWAGSYGWADIAAQVPVTPDTLFMLASVSKTVTAVALMQLYDDGLFDLDDDINEYLPFSVRNPNHPHDPITVRMLLTHTSSILDNWDVMEPLYVEGDSPISLERFCAGYLTPEGEYYDPEENYDSLPPGSSYEYSNVGVTLCGYLAERLAGIPFDEYCRQQIFIPLGMDETSWRLDGLDVNRIAIPYEYDGGQYQPQAHYGYPDYPDGALRTSVLQLARFLIAFINGGVYKNAHILKAGTVTEMSAVQFPALQSEQGLIWFYENSLLGHDGEDTGAFTRMFFRPEDGAGVILLANGIPSREALFYDIEERLFQEAGEMRIQA